MCLVELMNRSEPRPEIDKGGSERFPAKEMDYALVAQPTGG